MDKQDTLILGDHVEILSGFAFPSQYFTQEDGLPLIRIRDLFDSFTEIRYTGPYSETYLVQKNDVLIGMDGDFNTVRWSGDTALLNQRVCKVRSKSPDLDQGYLYHWLGPKITEINRTTPQTTVKHLSVSDIKQIKIPYFDPNEQRAIAYILDTLDKEIQETSAIIAKLQQMKIGLLDDLLTCGMDENGDLRDPERNPGQFERSRLGLYPKVWELTSLGKIIKENGGFIQTGPFGSQLHSHEYQDEGVPVIMPQDIIDGFISEEQIARISPEKANKLSRHLVQENDVIFARRGDLARCAPIESREVGWLCGTGSLLIRPPANAINGYWLAYTYRHDRSQRQILAAAVGSTMVNLNTSILTHLIVAKPPLHEQVEIVQRALQHDASIREEIEYQEKLQQLKKGLMDDLLTGRVPVVDVGSAMEIQEQTARDMIFISHARRDSEYLDELMIHLKALKRDVPIWSDKQIHPASTWRNSIQDALGRARVAILLVSPDFLASEFIMNEELKPIIEAARHGECLVIPISVRPAAYNHVKFLSEIQWANDPNDPIGNEKLRKNRDKKWAKIVSGIVDAFSDLVTS